jgi:hypothetical protein
MLAQIIEGTPKPVFVVFFVLLYYGWMQSRTREAGKVRVLMLPIIMVFLSIGGVLSSFHGHLPSLVAWVVGFLVAVVVNHLMGAPSGVRYSAATRRFHLPGSWTPLALMMAIYFAKYVDGATTVLRPDIQTSTPFAVTLSMIFGCLSGVFFGRFLRIWSTSLQAPVPSKDMAAAS